MHILDEKYKNWFNFFIAKLQNQIKLIDTSVQNKHFIKNWHNKYSFLLNFTFVILAQFATNFQHIA
jgi:hypothetical protein